MEHPSVPRRPTRAWVALTLLTVALGCGGDSDVVTPTPMNDPPPSISSFEPTEGFVGAEVTITGENFSAVPADNVVRVGGITTPVKSASATQLVVDVPAGAQTGSVSVTVAGQTTATTSDFTVLNDVGLPRTGLIAFYEFNNSAADSSGNGFDGVNNGAGAVIDRFGNASSAFQFRPDDHIDLGTVPEMADLGSSLTISAWIRPSSTTVVASGAIVSNFNPTTTGYQLEHGVGARVAFEIAGVGSVQSTSALTANEWTNVTVTYDGAQLLLYVDGLLAETQAGTGDVVAPSWSVQLGKERWANIAPQANFFDGDLDDVGFWARTLSASEVMDVFLQTDTR